MADVLNRSEVSFCNSGFTNSIISTNSTLVDKDVIIDIEGGNEEPIISEFNNTPDILEMDINKKIFISRDTPYRYDTRFRDEEISKSCEATKSHLELNFSDFKLFVTNQLMTSVTYPEFIWAYR